MRVVKARCVPAGKTPRNPVIGLWPRITTCGMCKVYMPNLLRYPFFTAGCRRGRLRSGAVDQGVHPAGAGAMGAAIHHLVDFEAMPDDAATAVRATGGQALNRAFERIEGIGSAVLSNVQAAVIVVAAGVADRHGILTGERTSEPAR